MKAGGVRWRVRPGGARGERLHWCRGSPRVVWLVRRWAEARLSRRKASSAHFTRIDHRRTLLPESWVQSCRVLGANVLILIHDDPPQASPCVWLRAGKLVADFLHAGTIAWVSPVGLRHEEVAVMVGMHRCASTWRMQVPGVKRRQLRRRRSGRGCEAGGVWPQTAIAALICECLRRPLVRHLTSLTLSA